jgi:uncharacterized membrane protein YhaH (DUF805 family)
MPAPMSARREAFDEARAIRWLHPLVLVASVPFLLLGLRRTHDARLRGLLLSLMVGVTANALAAGALSGPHSRYQARIAWLLPLGVALVWRRPSHNLGAMPATPVAASS